MVTTVVEFGCFMQLLDVGVDGLLHLTALRDDDYQMTRDGGAVAGQAQRPRLAPGTRLRVVVTAVQSGGGHGRPGTG